MAKLSVVAGLVIKHGFLCLEDIKIIRDLYLEVNDPLGSFCPHQPAATHVFQGLELLLKSDNNNDAINVK